jgi:hypothetical protein
VADFDLLDLLQAKSPEQRFTEFHAENPDVYVTLVRLARTKIQRTGCQKLGMQQLFEVLRWDVAMTTGDAEFKVNNNFAAHYARLIMRQEPDLAGRFEIRRSTADSIPTQRQAD